MTERAVEGRGRRERNRDGWHVAFGRILGRATRWASPKRPRRPKELLLRKLGEIIEQHASSDFASVSEDRRIWALVAQLHAQRPYPKPSAPRRRIKAEAQKAAGASGEQAVEARVAKPKESPEPEPAAAEEEEEA